MDQYRRIAKGLEDLAFTCSRCQREAMDVNDVADDDEAMDVVDDAVNDSVDDVVDDAVDDSVDDVVDDAVLIHKITRLIDRQSPCHGVSLYTQR